MPRDLVPFADYRPLGPQTEPPLVSPDIIVAHTMVGSLRGTEAYFEQSGYSGVGSHFGVGNECDGNLDGAIWQWQRLNRQADANLDGNDTCISIETSDCGEWRQPWSEAQLDSIVWLVRWLCDEYRIPARLIPDTRPGRRGIGYHRQGIDPWRVSGGVRWSSAYGKVCPGDTRIGQLVTQVIPRVRGQEGTEASGWTFPDIYLRRGDSGFWVRRLQRALNDLTDAGLTVDGIYGPATYAAVREYQRSEHITVDGIAGPVTLQHLEDDMAGPSAEEIARAVWEYNIPSGHKDNPEWWAQTFLINIEADGDQTQRLVRRTLDAAHEDRVTEGAPVRRKLRAIEAALADVSADVDEQAVATAVVAQLPAELADQVVDALAARDITVEIGDK